MIIKPKVRGFICTNAHPKGCAAHVNQQIEYMKVQGPIDGAAKKVLVIGCSTGYGLASRIAATFGSGADTLGVCFEKPPTERKTASAGYYNTAAFHQAAKDAGVYCETINGDAFSNECKTQTIDMIKADLGKVDLVVYSLASPRRTDPTTGVTHNSTLKPVGQSYTAKNLNTDTLKISDITLEPANEEEIANTVKVMGGEDWELWMQALADADVLADGAKTVAYTYLGEKLTWPIYGHATIGKAKEDLDRAASAIIEQHNGLSVQANVAVLKAVVTQASSAIPIMPLYISLMAKVMKEEGSHEDCIEQAYRLFTECLYNESPRLDDGNRFRVDDKELRPETQAKIEALWPQVTEENLFELTDFKGYNENFLRLFGFGLDGVDYEEDVSPLVDVELK
ncbi:enoyl-ACP reductase FabV [Pseudoteredinibacter isoporae]|uniref:Enoyl-[acyl-carrier-protein] reductase [NADH] n=1 Tax=Pseudoteredinibacter isoporae TaxID=570281 RepID=A0A7X0MWJ8_9GAMM|nr:enoyl-ACP reductase FabV [Pseudoteredinibacter isoporae]MBB6522796.1 enoyl-[acyl-carrier protein] reductase/trans-2-enoyl-CoA reductase (NAD+) [Pseudoteredinibacter isoporae]NHO88323.1 trans-2-enoyl-CoA reductase family protein [Pseudoteredinibacter isoporae]NIB23346.1 trans-2-enoyl-CoA reductase family protein [Pseudoteredinibacter isoporae]